MREPDKRFTYVARCSCGGVVMMTTNDDPKDATKEVNRCVKRGLAIETMSIEKAREQNWCTCSREKE